MDLLGLRPNTCFACSPEGLSSGILMIRMQTVVHDS